MKTKITENFEKGQRKESIKIKPKGNFQSKKEISSQENKNYGGCIKH